MPTPLPTIPTWYLPSFYGDVKLEATSDDSCRVITTEVTTQERAALVKLETTARKKEWILPTQTVSPEGTTAIKAPIAKVARLLARLLKPERTIISAVRFKDGTMEEIRTTPPTDSSTAAHESATPDHSGESPYRTSPPLVATSVAAPIRGCPAPDFSQAEIRAQRVLAAFLMPDQLADFRKHQQFISVGQTTGNRYMVTSRHARDELAKYHRSLYDLDRDVAICTHDWDVPASEEMLALHVLLQLPGWELYLNKITENNVEEALAAHVGHTEAAEMLDSDHTLLRLPGGFTIRSPRGRDIV